MKRSVRLISPPASSTAVEAVMRGNKKRDTRPELAVRRLIHSLGYRYRLYAKELPGKPDIVFRKRRKAIFVHGCFWHQHQSAECLLQSHPKSNVHYWKPKLTRNRERDRENIALLKDMNWKSLIIWECETKDVHRLARRIRSFLEKV